MGKLKHFQWAGRSRLALSGFTLIEILIVIVIIAILAVLSFAVSSRMKSNARSALCVSNMRQTGLILHAHTADLGHFPSSVDHTTGEDGSLANNGNTWDALVREENCVGCPAAKFYGQHPRFSRRQISGFGANPMIFDDRRDGDPPFVRPANISRPGEIILLADGAQFNDSSNPRSVAMCAAWWLSRAANEENAEEELTTRYIPDQGFWDSEVALLPLRHDGKANILFVDGHIASIGDISELKQKNLYWQY